MSGAVIVWLRQDLRLADNPALRAAAATKRPVVLLYVLDEGQSDRRSLGGASRWWLHHSLTALAKDLSNRGASLTLKRGEAAQALFQVIRETGAQAVVWNRVYEPSAVARDKRLKDELVKAGIEVTSCNGALLFEPWEVRTKSGEPFKVFTPFWRACMQMETRAPAPAPKRLSGFDGKLASDRLDDWKLLPSSPNWAHGFGAWRPGEAGARERLRVFVEERLQAYPESRDQLADDGTSRLSPHLHFGEISPVQVRAAIDAATAERPELQRGAEKFLAEIGWREFSTNLLFHWPSLPQENWRSAFDSFPWSPDPLSLRAWQRGRTGYPVVDAAMRQLWATGWMHNRARMIAASFLIKHLLVDWRQGEAWFWDTLVDADLANNAASWQWVAGSGADAAPYFRIFNPVTQGERYDADGAYVRRWIPELARLDSRVIHQPWVASAAELAAAGVVLGESYPRPIVDHGQARARALAAFASINGRG